MVGVGREEESLRELSVVLFPVRLTSMSVFLGGSRPVLTKSLPVPCLYATINRRTSIVLGGAAVQLVSWDMLRYSGHGVAASLWWWGRRLVLG